LYISNSLISILLSKMIRSVWVGSTFFSLDYFSCLIFKFENLKKGFSNCKVLCGNFFDVIVKWVNKFLNQKRFFAHWNLKFINVLNKDQFYKFLNIVEFICKNDYNRILKYTALNFKMSKEESGFDLEIKLQELVQN
jgi:hypothetical protein